MLGIRLVPTPFGTANTYLRTHEPRRRENQSSEYLHDDESRIRFFVMVPDEIALQLHNFELIVIHLGDDLRLRTWPISRLRRANIMAAPRNRRIP
jgi:hypothetical protein